MGRPVTCHKQKYENAKATTTIIKKNNQKSMRNSMMSYMNRFCSRNSLVIQLFNSFALHKIRQYIETVTCWRPSGGWH